MERLARSWQDNHGNTCELYNCIIYSFQKNFLSSPISVQAAVMISDITFIHRKKYLFYLFFYLCNVLKLLKFENAIETGAIKMNRIRKFQKKTDLLPWSPCQDHG